jgi:hypothetical protein
VERVANTRIYACALPEGRQFLAYQMEISAATPVAMILPIPTPPNSPPTAVHFVDLKLFPYFFGRLSLAFAPPLPSGAMIRGDQPLSAPDPYILPVIAVGNFVASFVPSLQDFGRLAPQFRLPENTWGKLPGYRHFGFVVFQLQPGRQEPHPMAFHFPRQHPWKLFFPTVHIHDGEVHKQADFDHVLYFQRWNQENLRGWEESVQTPAQAWRHFHESLPWVSSDAHLYRRIMNGFFANRDVVLA